MGARERSSAGALPVGSFGFLGVFSHPLRQAAVTSQPKANSQVRLCRGVEEEGSRGAGEHSQWGSDSSDCRAGKLEFDVRCTGGGRCGSCGGLWLWRDMDAEMGTARWKAGLGLVIGRLLDGEDHSAFPCQTQTRKTHSLLSICPSSACVLQSARAHRPVISQPLTHSLSQLFSQLSDQTQAQAQTAWVVLWALELPSHSRRASPGAQR